MEREIPCRKKGGRPAKAVKKEKQTGIRFTKAEYFVIKNKAAKAGTLLTAYIRHMALHGQIKERLNDEERTIARQLIAMATNINQIAKCAHEQGMLSALLLFEKYRSFFDDLLKRYNNDQ